MHKRGTREPGEFKVELGTRELNQLFRVCPERLRLLATMRVCESPAGGHSWLSTLHEIAKREEDGRAVDPEIVREKLSPLWSPPRDEEEARCVLFAAEYGYGYGDGNGNGSGNGNGDGNGY